MTPFPQAFTQMLSDTYGPETAARVLQALGSGTPSVSIRLNPFRQPDLGTKTPDFVPMFSSETDLGTKMPDFVPVPWNPHGRILRERPNFTLDPLFHAGCYYVQDSSAMFVGELLRRCLDGKAAGLGGPLEKAASGIRVLDLCAAPGGKTTDAAASLRERFGDAFTLLANEVMRPRFGILRSNVRSWGDPRVGVVCRDPAVFGAEGPCFDIMIADVPCSGEGMFRKDPRALAEWSPETVTFCAARQRRILSDSWPALRPGGILIYSTCTFNPDENDGQIQWIAENLGARVLDMGCPPEGILRTPEGGYVLLPGLVPGEGQFAAVLQKGGDAPAAGDPFRIFRAEIPCTSHGMTKSASHGMTKSASHGMTKSANHGMTESSCPANAGHLYEVDRQTALQFLHGDALRLPDAPKGLLTLTYRGQKLGQVKNIGTRCNNLYPKDRRIRMDIPIE